MSSSAAIEPQTELATPVQDQVLNNQELVRIIVDAFNETFNANRRHRSLLVPLVAVNKTFFDPATGCIWSSAPLPALLRLLPFAHGKGYAVLVSYISPNALFNFHDVKHCVGCIGFAEEMGGLGTFPPLSHQSEKPATARPFRGRSGTLPK